LPDKIFEIRKKVEFDPLILANFEDRLLSSSYLTSHSQQYHRKFLLLEIFTLEVDSNFPNMTHGNVKSGVISAKYQINLEPLIKRDVGLIAALKKLEMI